MELCKKYNDSLRLWLAVVEIYIETIAYGVRQSVQCHCLSIGTQEDLDSIMGIVDPSSMTDTLKIQITVVELNPYKDLDNLAKLIAEKSTWVKALDSSLYKIIASKRIRGERSNKT